MTTYYCTASDVASIMGLGQAYFTTNSKPSQTEVEAFINMQEDFIDEWTHRAWREKRALRGEWEYHTLGRIGVRGCLLPKSCVWFNDRPEFVEDIVDNSPSRVISGDGYSQKVIRSEFDNYTGEAYVIKPKLLQPIRVTPEHPFYVVRLKNHYGGVTDARRCYRDRVKLFEGWLTAKELTKDDYLVIPKLQVEYGLQRIKLEDRRSGECKELLVDETFARFLGWYVAEGSTNSRGNIALSLNRRTDPLQDIVNLIGAMGYSARIYDDGENSVKIKFKSHMLSRWLRENCGKCAIEKRVPSCIFVSPANVRLAFVKAFIAGDGWTRREAVGMATRSIKLWNDLTFLLIGLNIIPIATSYKMRERSIDGRILRGGGVNYSLQIYGRQRAKLTDMSCDEDGTSQRFIEEENRFLIPIRNIERIKYTGRIYNVVTEDDTFAMPFKTHNSWFVWLGYPVFLKYRNVRQFDANQGDALEVFNGSTWEDWLATKQEGIGQDYWIDYDNGIIYFRGLWVYLGLKEYVMRAKYRYGKTEVPTDLKMACALLTAATLVESTDMAFLLPEGGTQIVSASEKAMRWRERALNILDRYRDWVVGGG